MVIDVVPVDVAEQRQTICDACEHRSLGICTKCNCVLAFKTRLAGASCPENKWSRYHTQDSQ